ncbi:HAD family hydrolase [Neisseria sp. CCUG12390]|uniref:HAD family hydrolase n=1 Tax=Neisseria sp. CCUG12390 TaxID=3392035 RepID=UPI003A0FC2F1
MKTVNPADTVLVFDLDDTLYSEYEYKVSGIRAVIRAIAALYPEYDADSLESAVNFQDNGWLDALCRLCRLNESEKQSLLWQYRLHQPVIRPYLDKESLADLTRHFAATALITDGRSMTQRLKLQALDLADLFDDILISESYQSEKPAAERFVHLQDKYGAKREFIYVGDNIKKDFVTPKAMGWLTVGLKPSAQNIHRNHPDDFAESHHPHCWIDTLSDLHGLFDI